MKYNSFEELPIWKEAINIGKEIYLLTEKGKFKTDFSLKDQIRRAIVSISSNIAEGFERANNNEFIRFLLISKGSVGEVRSQLYFGLCLGYLDKQVFEKTNKGLKLLARQIGGFISYLKKERLFKDCKRE